MDLSKKITNISKKKILKKKIIFRNRPIRSIEESLILATYHDYPRHFQYPRANNGGNFGECVRKNRIRHPDDKTTLTIIYNGERKLLTVLSNDLRDIENVSLREIYQFHQEIISE